MTSKSDSQIMRRLDAEYAACQADPTLKENDFLRGYIKILEICKGASASFVEGLLEGLEFVNDEDKR